MRQGTKLTYKYILSNLDKIYCPCIVEPCMSCKGEDLLPYLQSIGYSTNKNTLKHTIQTLVLWHGRPYYSNIYYANRTVLYDSKLVRDICKVYRAFQLGRQTVEKIVNG